MSLTTLSIPKELHGRYKIATTLAGHPNTQGVTVSIIEKWFSKLPEDIQKRARELAAKPHANRSTH